MEHTIRRSWHGPLDLFMLRPGHSRATLPGRGSYRLQTRPNLCPYVLAPAAGYRGGCPNGLWS